MNLPSANRIDPSLFSEGELENLTAAFAQPGHVRFTDDLGNKTEIPEELFRHIARILRLMEEGRPVCLIPEDEEFTTQAAANYLGMSRQHLVNLLESGDIPHRKVGTHRRVSFQDIRAYEVIRDKERGEALDRMFKKIKDAGLDDGEFVGTTR